MMLEVVEVSKFFGRTVALDRASFRVEEGEVFGLLGPNGAGKTTLMSIISYLLNPDGGEVRLLGQAGRPHEEVSRLIGIVPQELAIYDNLTARENIVFFGELFGLWGSELGDRADHLLAAVGLDNRASDRVANFSGGMKRRLNLAVSLVHKPRLLLLDEPTVGVDPQSRNLIFEEVRRLNREGMTVIYTSHYMEEVEALCRRVGIIDQGRVVACDTLPGLLQSLRGLIRVRVGGAGGADQRIAAAGEAPAKHEPAPPSGAAHKLQGLLEALPDVRVRCSGDELEVECGDVKGTLIKLIGLMNEAQAELLHLETQEPNLERVFLHLTGRALRD
jgi:ABC-2 type transport system ATP-binding protein